MDCVSFENYYCCVMLPTVVPTLKKYRLAPSHSFACALCMCVCDSVFLPIFSHRHTIITPRKFIQAAQKLPYQNKFYEMEMWLLLQQWKYCVFWIQKRPANQNFINCKLIHWRWISWKALLCQKKNGRQWSYTVWFKVTSNAYLTERVA